MAMIQDPARAVNHEIVVETGPAALRTFVAVIERVSESRTVKPFDAAVAPPLVQACATAAIAHSSACDVGPAVAAVMLVVAEPMIALPA